MNNVSRQLLESNNGGEVALGASHSLCVGLHKARDLSRFVDLPLGPT
jgi:hypothetical protein